MEYERNRRLKNNEAFGFVQLQGQSCHLLTCRGTNLVGEDQKLLLNFECFELSDIQEKCRVEIVSPEVQETGLSI